MSARRHFVVGELVIVNAVNGESKVPQQLHWYVVKRDNTLKVIQTTGMEAMRLMHLEWEFGHHPLVNEEEAHRYMTEWASSGVAPLGYAWKPVS